MSLSSATIIGAGKIGLGLLYPWVASVAERVVLVNRRSNKSYSRALRENRTYTIATPSQRWSQHSVQLLEYDPGALESSDSRLCIDRVAASDVVCLAVGVPNLGSVAPIIARASLQRRRPLHVLVFENSQAACKRLSSHVSEYLGPMHPATSGPVRYYPTVPDRACLAPNVEDGNVVVPTETFGEIILETSASEFFAPQDTVNEAIPLVRLVSKDRFDLYEHRKFWLVNGTHLALGVLCLKIGLSAFSDALQDRNVFTIMQELHSEWTSLLTHLARERGCSDALLSHEQLTAHSKLMISRLRDLPHLSPREVMRELYEIGQGGEDRDNLRMLARLLEKIDARLASQIRQGFELRSRSIPLPFTAGTLAQSLKIIEEYTERFVSA